MAKHFVFLMFLLSFATASLANDDWLDELYEGQILIAEQAILDGANVNAFNEEWGSYPIHIAFYSNSLNAIEMLAAHGADLNAYDDNAQTVMDLALEQGNYDAVRLLYALGSKLEIEPQSEISPIHYAVISGNAQLISWVIEKGFDVNKASATQWNVLDSLMALEQESLEPLLAETLLQAGLDRNLRSRDDYSLLHWAASYEQAALVKTLLEQGFDPFDLTFEDESVYELGYYSDNDDLITFLYQDIQKRVQDLKGNGSTEQDRTLNAERLRYAIRLNDIKGFEQHFTKQDLNYRSVDSSTLLHFAVLFHRVNISQFLLEQGASLLDTNFYDDTALNIARYDDDNPVLAVIVKEVAENGPSGMRIQLAGRHLHSGDIEQFSALRPYLTLEEIDQLDFEYYFENSEDNLGAWLKYAVNSDEVLLSKLYPYVPTIYDDEEFLHLLSVLQGAGKTTPNALILPLLVRLLDVEVDYIGERKTTFETAWQEVAQDTQKIIESGFAEEILPNYIRYQEYSLAFRLLNQMTPEFPQHHLSVLFEEYPDETNAEIEALVTKLMEHGADPTLNDDDGVPLFFEAAGIMSQTLFDLIVRDTDLNEYQSNAGASLLHFLVASASERAQTLLEADRFTYQSEWDQLLRVAYNQGNEELCFLLWSKGAQTQSTDSEGLLFITTVYQGRFQTEKPNAIAFTDWLANSREPIESLTYRKDLNGKSLFDYLIASNDHKTLNWLFDNGLMVTNDAILSFASSDNIKLVSALVEPLSPSLGVTLLHSAISEHNEGLIEHLLASGVDPFAFNEKRQTAFEMAMYSAKPSVIELLSPYYAEPVVTFTAGDSYFDNELIRYWSWLFNTGEISTLIAHLEKHILNGNAHPFARQIWINVQYRQYNLEQVSSNMSSELKSAMGKGFEPMLFSTLGKYDEAIEQFQLLELTEQDLWLINEMATFYIDANDQLGSWQVLEQGVKVSPNFWQFSWRYFDIDWLNRPEFRARALALVNSPELEGTVFSQYGQAVLAQRNVSKIDLRELKQKWFEKTRDARLLTSIGYLYSDNNYLDRAQASFEQAVMSYPFYSNWSKYTEIIAKRGDDDLLDTQTRIRARWYSEKKESHAVRQQRYRGQSLLSAGDKGQVHEIYQSLANKRSSLLGYNIATLERSEGRHLQAVRALEPLLQNEDFDADDWVNIIDSYSEIGETARAITLFNNALAVIPYPTISLYIEGLQLYKSTQMSADYDKLLQKALTVYPTSTRLLKEQTLSLLDKKQFKQSVEVGRKMLALWPRNRPAMKALYQAIESAENKENADIAFLEMAQSQPWNEPLWTFVVSKSQNPDEIWQVLQQVPEFSAKAIRHRIDLAIGKKKFDVAEQLLAQIPDTPISLNESLELQLSTMWLVRQKSRNVSLSKEVLSRHLSEWKNYKDNFANLTNYYIYQRDLLYAMNETRKAAQVMKTYSNLDKDSTEIYYQMVSRYHEELTSQDVYGYGYRMIQRNPYSASIINSFVKQALYWGQGGAVIALQVMEDAKQRGVVLNKKWEEKALSDLGDNLASFLGYRHYSGISNSLRYIGWFNSARESALRGDGNQVRYRFEGEQPEVEIILPSGEVLVRRDDATIGKMIYVGRGGSYIKAQYNQQGSLTKIEDSSKSSVTLQYDIHENIVKMTSTDAIMQLKYNERGKPVDIALMGVGSISVIYDNNDEIVSVNSDAGHKLSLKITQAFQELLSLAKSLGNASNNFELPDLSAYDEKREQLSNIYDQTESNSSQERTAALNLAKYLFEHSDLNQNNVDKITSLTEDIYFNAHNTEGADVEVAQAILLWHELKNRVRPYGVTKTDYQLSQQMKLWMSANNTEAVELKALGRILNKIALTELKTQSWIEENDVSNSGYWYRETLPSQLGKTLDVSDLSAMVSLDNGEVIAGTSQGLLLRRDNYWSWFTYQGANQKLVRTGERPDESPRAHINDIKVAADGVVWIATNGGVFALKQDDTVVRWDGVNDGMPSAIINAILVETPSEFSMENNSVFVAINNQIFSVDQEKHTTTLVNSFSSNIDEFLRLPDGKWLVRSGDVLVILPATMAQNSEPLIVDTLAQGVKQILWQSDNDLLWWWDGSILKQAQYQRGQFIEVNAIADKALLPMSQRIHGLSWVEVPKLGRKPVVLTDQGLAIWHEERFTVFSLPYKELRGGLEIGPLALVSSHQDWTLMTEEAVYQFTPSRSQRFNDVGRVHDMLYIPEMEKTFAANGNEILSFYENDTGNIESNYFKGLRARLLRRDSVGNLITHSGNSVIRVDKESEDYQELFRATSDDKSGRIADIFVDHDDSIWVAAGADLFHWTEEKLERFNFYVDPIAFPARSNMLARVFRDIEGTLFVVASDEGHLYHNSVSLVGGLLKLTDSGFERVSLDDKPTWFATAYTPIGEDSAIISTSSSFVLDRHKKWSSFSSMNDVSYNAMSEQAKMIYLGGKGAKLPQDNAWLFPSAGGVVIYYQGQWLYPDRLNQLLPDDQKLGQYGARVIHTVSVDAKGRVYVGTDRGVLLYKAGNMATLLSDHNRGQQAFVSQNNDIQTELANVFIDNIPEDSEQGKLVAKVQTIERELEQLENQLEEGPLQVVLTQKEVKTADTKTVVVDKKKVEKSIKKQERKRQRLLAQLERDFPALFQMLQIDPREIGAMNDKLAKNQVLLQFIPSPDKLLTQVVTNNGIRILEIDATEEELNKHLDNAIFGLRQGAFTLDTNELKTSIEALEKQRGFIKSAPKSSQNLNHSLVWLYDKLLRPVEAEMKGKDQVYITPVGKLNYLPFGSLIKSIEPSIEYAVETLNIGILPSLYHFNLVMNDEASLSDQALFISDPDGSLPGAKQEVDSIALIYKDDAMVLQGVDANLEELESLSLDSQVIHFATHGVLNTESAVDSYLVMANDEKLSVIDISVMDLSETDVVVLSACESGIGTKGLEYASLARAFAHAKVPSVVASYWQVNDDATSELMQIFYREIQNPEINLFEAMANAQRAMISRGGVLANPAAWASFSVFGKP